MAGHVLVTAEHIITMSDGEPVVSANQPALAFLGEWITAVGELDQLRERFPDAEVVDFGKATIVPGFNDAHQHPTMTAANERGVDLSRASSRTELLAELRRRAATTPPGEWVLGTRYDHGKSTGGEPLTRFDLDQVSVEHPILVINIGAHWGVLNSPGLERAGFSAETPPPEGGEFGRDAAGQLTGVVHEQALFDVAYPSLARRRPVLPPQDQETALRSLRRVARRLNAAGITSVGDAMTGPDELSVLQESRRRGELTVRVNALVTFRHFDVFRESGLRSGFGDHWLRLGGVKAFADGAVAGGTCLVEEPFEGTADHGIQTLSTAELTDLVSQVHSSGNRLAVHANGDRAIKLVLDAMERAAREHPDVRVEHRIEHCSLVDGGIVARMRELGVIAVPFGSYVAFHGDKLVDYYGLNRLERMFAHRSLLDAGIPVAGSSDFPCGPFEPLLALASCVTRQSVFGRTAGQVLGGSQRISVLEALGLYTTGSARASGETAVKGRLLPGQLADFVVLSENPVRVAPQQLSSIEVLATWVGGEEVWRKGDRSE